MEERKTMKKNKKQILVVTTKPAMSEGLNNWAVKNAIHDLKFADSEERAIELCNRQSFELVVLDHTGTDAAFRKLFVILPILCEEIAFVSYNGEEEKILERKVKSLENKKKAEKMKRFLILDSTNPDAEDPIGFSLN
jgi:hypothetical protein